MNPSPLYISLCRNDLMIIYTDAKKACIGGVSHVRSSRGEEPIIDQMVGLAGNYALCMWRDGDNRAYLDMRHTQNRFSDQGDGGYDLPRCRFDIKTSMMRSGGDPMKYNLPVRPAERHDGWVYGLALVEAFTLETLKDDPCVGVYLVGWCHDSDLPAQPEGVGTFKGAYVVSAKALTPFTPLIYEGMRQAYNKAS